METHRKISPLSLLAAILLTLHIITPTSAPNFHTVTSASAASVTPDLKASLDVPNSTYHFVLVHGFESGAWAWYKVRTLLEASGFKVTCLDLKACGVDLTPVESIKSFDSYTQPLIEFFENYSRKNSHEKVILVGHSAGGLSVTDATYKFPEKIDVAVYVAASMLKHGYATQQDRRDGVPGQHQNSSKEIVIHMPPEDMILDSMLRRKGPIDAIKGAKFSGNDTVEQVPRVYVRTLQDQVLIPKQQLAMISRWPPARVYSLETDHVPLFSSPFLLSGLLANAVDEILK